MSSSSDIVAVVGAGTMGVGIAQVAAAAGHSVLLYDGVSGAARRGRDRIASALTALSEREKISRSEADQRLERIGVCSELAELSPAVIVVEAIVEDLDAKTSLFGALEQIVSPSAILATNTSSISITAIAARLSRPDRFAGLHFFNPAPVMKLVEVVAGHQTSEECTEALVQLAERWGKIAVRARSTPGFIVNRVARPFYGEALRLFEESVAEPSTIDVLMKEAGGFRMGPFELMDLIGHDVNYAVTKSVYDAFYQDPRFRPALAQLELVNAGRLGRKSGAGFYDYSAGRAAPGPQFLAVSGDIDPWPGDIFTADAVEIDGVTVARTDGRTAQDRQAATGRPTIVYDLMLDPARATVIGFAPSPSVSSEAIARFVATVQRDGRRTIQLADWPALVVARTVAMLVNEAFETVLTGVADEDAVDTAMVHGVNYPLGPIAWGRRIGVSSVLEIVENLFAATGDPRYRPSMGLRKDIGRHSESHTSS